jgi:hypothetical protein
MEILNKTQINREIKNGVIKNTLPTPLTLALRRLKVGEGFVLTKKEWFDGHISPNPSVMLRVISARIGIKIQVLMQEHRQGWIITRVA